MGQQPERFKMRRKMEKTFAVLVAALFCLAGSGVQAAGSPDGPLAADRWLEIDLYWFDQGDIGKSCEEFWDRFAPLFEGVQGWRGIILNVGWTVDYVMDWSGDLDQRIVFPVGIKQDPWTKEDGVLTGTTDERVQAWKERFAHPIDSQKKDYEPWTYGDLKTLAASLRNVAEKEHGLTQMRVGALTLGWEGPYHSKSPWALRHPEAFAGKGWRILFAAARLTADPLPIAACPSGIPESMPFYELFGKQWGSLSKAVELDAIVLRDSMLLQVQYQRGRTVFDPARAKLLHEGAAGMVRETKKANPDALVMGYSNGASAMSDWRCNGVDLESIFKEGFMDAWIDQTWAGAWNEVGVRHQDFWNAPFEGWTYQLPYTLMHAAMLADTKVHHYPLVETFDAWESWDIIDTVPERLQWGIWAYSHAAVKTPHGLKMPGGTYISWANQGTRLLEPDQVTFLATNINAAVRDALATTDVYGPTMVYCRDAEAWQMAHAPADSIKEWLDEQVGTLIKWTVPIGSITRVEYLPDIKSDAFIVGTPVHLQPKQRQALADVIERGRPVMLVGSPDGGVDPELLKLAGVVATGTAQERTCTRATLGSAGDLTTGLPSEFETIQHPVVPSKTVEDVRVLYTVDGNPALTINTNGNRRLIFWDPPDMVFTRGRPLIETLGGIEPYVLAARSLTELLKGSGSPRAAAIHPRETVAVLAWRGQDGIFNLFAGNLEEGLNLDVAKSRKVTRKQYQDDQVPAGLDLYVKDSCHVTMDLPVSWCLGNGTENPVEIFLPRTGSIHLEFK